jgi:hypothetical protein
MGKIAIRTLANHPGVITGRARGPLHGAGGAGGVGDGGADEDGTGAGAAGIGGYGIGEGDE